MLRLSPLLAEGASVRHPKGRLSSARLCPSWSSSAVEGAPDLGPEGRLARARDLAGRRASRLISSVASPPTHSPRLPTLTIRIAQGASLDSEHVPSCTLVGAGLRDSLLPRYHRARLALVIRVERPLVDR